MRNVRNRVIVLAAIVQLTAWALPLFTLKENRVVSGVSLYSWDVFPIGICIIAALLPFGILFLVSRATDQRRLSPLYAAVALIQIVLACAAVARTVAYINLLGGNARLGLHIGFWMMIVAGVVIAGHIAHDAPRWITRSLVPAMVLTLIISIAIGIFNHVGIHQEFVNNQSRFLSELLNHLFLVFISVAIATTIGIPLGIYAWRKKNIGKIIFPIVNSINTIPSLALFGLLIGPLSILTRALPALRSIGITGIGNTPAIIALSLYALLPIVQNTYSGLANIPHAVIDAAVGIGMDNRQLWRHIEFPLSFALIFNGFRTATTQTIGNAAVAALIGATGLGNFIFRGLGSAATDLVMLGVLPIVLLSVIFDQLLTHCNTAYQRYILHRRVVL